MAYNETMLLMFTNIRALTEDFVQSDVEVFTYETTNIFTISEPRVNQMIEVLINGMELQSGQSAEFDATTNDVTVVNEGFVSGDIISVKYSFSKNTNNELYEYVRSALIWLSIYDSSVESYNLTNAGTVIPTPDKRTLNLICLIAAILIKPDFISYKTSSMSITYPNKLSKEEKIKEAVQGMKFGTGVVRIVEKQ